eukprot:UN31401
MKKKYETMKGKYVDSVKLVKTIKDKYDSMKEKHDTVKGKYDKIMNKVKNSKRARAQKKGNQTTKKKRRV